MAKESRSFQEYEPYNAMDNEFAQGPSDEKEKQGLFRRAVMAVRNAMTPPATREDARFEAAAKVFAPLQETGILPLKIRLPKSGNVYRFNRLMTTQEALTLDATFVHLPMPWVPFAVLGLLVLPLGITVAVRYRPHSISDM